MLNSINAIINVTYYQYHVYDTLIQRVVKPWLALGLACGGGMSYPGMSATHDQGVSIADSRDSGLLERADTRAALATDTDSRKEGAGA